MQSLPVSVLLRLLEVIVVGGGAAAANATRHKWGRTASLNIIICLSARDNYFTLLSPLTSVGDSLAIIQLVI